MAPFGKQEFKELLISALAITFIFAFDNVMNFNYSLLSRAYVFLIYFGFVGLSFIIHESAHKFMAKSLGAWSEFRMWAKGLVFALLMRIVGGPIFIAPGATLWVKRNATLEDRGKVSAAGPISNIILALIFWILSFFMPIMKIGMDINFMLAMFNLFPFPPLDGYSIFSWKPLIWVFLFTSTICLKFVLGG